MNKNLKTILTLVVSVLLILLTLVFCFFGYRYWQMSTGRIVKVGNVWMTHEAFHEQYPDPNAPVPAAKNTPEEVYVKFREAILANDVEGALKYIAPKKREEYRKRFNDQKVLKNYQTIPDVKKLIPGMVQNDYWVGYEYKGNESDKEMNYSVDFEMDRNGYWFIELI